MNVLIEIRRPRHDGRVVQLLLGGLTLALIAALEAPSLVAQSEAQAPRPRPQVDGIFPHLSIASEHDPRSEAGIGALVPWADRLWMVGYVAHIKGAGLGLYEVDASLSMRRHPASVTGTFANRLIHNPSNQAIIGPHIIDTKGGVRTFPEMAKHRLAATMEHLKDPQNFVYFLTMEGLLFEANVKTLEARQLFDLVKVLELPEGTRPHFKSAYTEAGRVVVANNTYDERDFKGELAGGRLAEWDGTRWTILERKPFVEVMGKAWAPETFGRPIYATGWDRASAILKVFLNGSLEHVSSPQRWTDVRPRVEHGVDAHPRGADRALSHGPARFVLRVAVAVVRGPRVGDPADCATLAHGSRLLLLARATRTWR